MKTAKPSALAHISNLLSKAYSAHAAGDPSASRYIDLALDVRMPRSWTQDQRQAAMILIEAAYHSVVLAA
jgi:hypothetical protein